jgi:hypothetical protein
MLSQSYTLSSGPQAIDLDASGLRHLVKSNEQAVQDAEGLVIALVETSRHAAEMHQL